MSRAEGDSTLTAMDRSTGPRPAPIELATDSRVGRYVVKQRLGVGGMGVVYAAWDTELARDVALKIVRAPAEACAMQARLRREAKAMARLSHPNVVPVFDIGTQDGQLFIAMELVAGDTLRSWVTSPRPWRSVVQLFARAGRGLHAAHAAGLLHRDFKPDNVMVGRDDEPRITDFGLARDLEDDAGPATPPIASPESELSQITATGSLAGTPAYMAPEQLLGSQGGPRADQFSFCVSLFEVLYGARPFQTQVPRLSALITEIRAGRIAKPAASRGVPGWLHAAIVRGLAFDPDDRWPSMLALVGALDRRRRGPRRLAAGAAAAIAVGLAVIALRHDRAAPPRCSDVAPRGNDAVTILVCKDEYARTSDPQVGLRLAHALRHTGQRKEATTVATELLATEVRADALYALGRIADEDGRRDDAERALRMASELHRDRQQWGESAGDLQALAAVSNDAVDQLVGLDQAAGDARRGHESRIEAFCHLTAAIVLSKIGARSGALAEIDRAGALLTAPSDRLQLDFQRGNVYQNLGDHAPAVAAFRRALAGAESTTSARFALAAHLNLAYSLGESGHLTEAAAELKAAGALDPDNRKLADRLPLEARVAARTGDLAGAAELLGRAIAATAPEATGDLLERDVDEAEVALWRGEPSVAETWARRGIERTAALRSSRPPVELRSWLVTFRRVPHELLFTSLAARGDAAGALVAFDRTRGLGVLAGLTRGEAGTAPVTTTPGVAFPVAELARLLPALQASALVTPPDERAILGAVRDASLLALVVARGELWRITAEAGRLDAARLGPVSALRARIDRFAAAPGDRAAAAALGDALVPAELARPSDRVLHVVLDQPLAGLPVEALQVGDRRLGAARPIVRAARAADLGCAALPPGPRPVAIDPGAPRAAVLDAIRADRLVITAPVEHDELGEVLVLGEGRVRALEIAGRSGTAAQVVLATPGAEPAGATSLAMAFIAAGADQVIAPVRPVSGERAGKLAEALARSGGRDLVRALARLQTTGDDWLGFAAFGRSACNPEP